LRSRWLILHAGRQIGKIGRVTREVAGRPAGQDFE